MRLYQSSSASVAAGNWLYDSAQPIALYLTSTGALAQRYIMGPGIDEPLMIYKAGGATKTWIVADERGSVVAGTDSSGNAAVVNTYDEYGIPGSANALRFQYTGQIWLDELGMYYYKARMYSPTLGRFMQTDPIGYGDGMNWYNYVGGDPINFSDPRGLSCVTTEWYDSEGKLQSGTSGDCNDDGGWSLWKIITTTVSDVFGGGGGGGSPIEVPDCPPASEPRIVVSYGAGGTAFSPIRVDADKSEIGGEDGLNGGSVSVDAGIAIPLSSFLKGSLVGAQGFGSVSITGLQGQGEFIGGGRQATVGAQIGPITPGPSTNYVLQGGGAFEAGAEGFVNFKGDPGNLSVNGLSVTASRDAGYGLYGGAGLKTSYTAATPQLGCKTHE